MKRLLSLLSVLTISGSAVPTTIAASPYQKQETKLETNEVIFETDKFIYKKIHKNVSADLFKKYYIDSKDNIYFVDIHWNFYKLFAGSNTVNKIDGIKGNISKIKIDSKDNVYIITNVDAYKLSAGSTKVIGIDGIEVTGIHNYINSIAIDSIDNVYFATNNGLYLLKQSETSVTEMGDTKNKIIVSDIVIDKNDKLFLINGPEIYTLENKINYRIQHLEKDYKFLGHDYLEIYFDFNIVHKIINIFINSKKEEFIKELKEIINHLNKVDHSGWGGSITESDENTIVNFIWQHFPYFHETYKNMAKNQKLIIKTNTIGYFDNENVNNSIYIN
ncbi:hypothetical protein [Spiroplasma endosymbiont of Poecilobothrus nobilitatus]|uniref:hypothetical protein n=1 Tax=Spiroplasma endosymbiont of Poecilobothrus nobilitatus TaxID=1209220 RepID=UPI00313E1172